jgi:hypothetical protein
MRDVRVIFSGSRPFLPMTSNSIISGGSGIAALAPAGKNEKARGGLIAQLRHQAASSP